MRESFIVGVLAVGICSQAAAERREHTKSTRGAEAAAIHTSGACFRLLNRLAGRSVTIMAASLGADLVCGSGYARAAFLFRGIACQ